MLQYFKLISTFMYAVDYFKGTLLYNVLKALALTYVR